MSRLVGYDWTHNAFSNPHSLLSGKPSVAGGGLDNRRRESVEATRVDWFAMQFWVGSGRGSELVSQVLSKQCEEGNKGTGSHILFLGLTVRISSPRVYAHCCMLRPQPECSFALNFFTRGGSVQNNRARTDRPRHRSISKNNVDFVPPPFSLLSLTPKLLN
jgi:hypothetical protein